MSRRRESTYDSSNLADALYKTWLTRGPFKIYTSNKLGPSKDNNIERHKGRVHVKLNGIEHFLWFEENKAIQKGDTNILRYSFCDHVLRDNKEKQEQIIFIINKRLEGINEDRRKKFYEIYEKPALSVITKDMEKTNHGVLIKSDIVRIPLGREGHLSDNLFEYSYNIITLPVTRFINGIPLSDNVWYEFRGNEKFT